MANFNVDKKGYNIEQVDEYINKMYLKYENKLSEQKDRLVALKNEVDALNEKLANYVNKDEQISKALIFAVEKAEQIENSARNVFNMEIKRVNALYERWEELLLEVEKECPQVNKNAYINSLMQDFKSSIDEISKNGITLDNKTVKEELKKNSDNFIKNILNRMDYMVNSGPVELVEEKPKAKKENKKPETQKVVEKPASQKTEIPKKVEQPKVQEVKKDAVKPEKVAKPEPSKVKTEDKPKISMSAINERLKKLNFLTKEPAIRPKRTESMAEKYLNSDEELKLNAYSKNFAKRKLEKNNNLPFDYMQYPEPNESGFDLKDALNPKEDLDEIMKAFDFFDVDKE